MITFNMIFIVLSTIYWPVRDFNGSHPVSATLGDARDYPRFHRGIDIATDFGRFDRRHSYSV